MEVYPNLELSMDTFYKNICCLIIKKMSKIFTWLLDEVMTWGGFLKWLLDKNPVVIMLHYVN